MTLVNQTEIGTAASGAFCCHQKVIIIFIDFHSLGEWRGQLRHFLSPLAPQIRHRDVADSITQGTGKWFLKHPKFKEWLRQEGDGARILCCVGDQGVGKTGLACVVSFSNM
jgi:hypothetical protein